MTTRTAVRARRPARAATWFRPVVRFLEYNFLGPVGQLAASDAKVRNIGSLLDPALTGIPVPE